MSQFVSSVAPLGHQEALTPTPSSAGASDANLTAKQREANQLLAQSHRETLLEGGSRSGKTFLLVRAIVMRALKARGSSHAIFRFRFNHLKSSIIAQTIPAVMAKCFPQVQWHIDKTDWCMKLNGSTVWFGGLDDKLRTEKVLGQEHATIYLNEVSQIPFEARNTALTRLAQRVNQSFGGRTFPLALRAYYDCNPPSKGHWIYRLFHELEDPISGHPLTDKTQYRYLRINPRDNLENLPAEYIDTLASLPARQRKRFLEGEYAEANPDALWTEETLDKYRIIDDPLPDMQRIVVGVDPSGSDDEDNAANDEIGIVVAGLGIDGVAYVAEDCSVKAGPATWGRTAVSAFQRHAADRIVAEQNFGGAMVKHVIATAREEGARRVPVHLVTASRGKVVRAEPIASLYEQGKVRHIGYLNELENEYLQFSTHGYTGSRSPNRADAAIWALHELFPGMVRTAVRNENQRMNLVHLAEM